MLADTSIESISYLLSASVADLLKQRRDIWYVDTLWEISMTERWYRLLQGIYLLVALYIENDAMMYAFMAVLTLEVLTNIRLSVLLARINSKTSDFECDNNEECFTFSMDSERLLRVVVVSFLLLSYVFFPEPIWFFPWFVAAMLFLAGITNICPMVMMFQFLGFR